MNILITEIVWDTEGESKKECCLPDAIVVLDVPQPTADEDMEENLGEIISEAFGFCHYGFKWETFSKVHDTHAGGGFYPDNLAIIGTPA
jgi:hypothetical protein